ncbi:MAG: prepilin peptidase [Pseudomonadota bacterium]
MEQIPNWINFLFAGMFGALVGSFLNVCIVRLPREESIILPRSHCRSCEHQLSWWENIPIFSYLILKGKCRHCQEQIPVRYPAVELITIMLSLTCWKFLGQFNLYTAYFLLLVCPLIVVTFIDLEFRIIPNQITLPGIAAGFLVSIFFAGKYTYYEAALNSMLGILVGGGFLYLVAFIYEKLKKAEGMGGGDVKLAAMLGAFFGWRAAIFILFASSVLGSLVGLLLLIIKKKDAKFAFPFGPFLALAGLIYFFFGKQIIGWYLGLF